MRCPTCSAELSDTAAACDACGTDASAATVAGDAGWLTSTTGEMHQQGADVAVLGRFHPVIAPSIAALLTRRGIGHTLIERDDEVEVRIDRAWRDDVRAELTVTWGDLVRRLDAEDAAAVLASGGTAPGWFDPPRGGHVDRAGRLVVAVDDEDAEDDAARVLGPLLLTVGAITLVVGWWVLGSGALAVAGFGLAVVGLFVPR
jgi:hypothetical protein